MPDPTLLKFFLTSFISIFVIVNPLGAVPLFISLTEGYGEEKTRTTAFKASTICSGILLIFTFGTSHILQFFGITIPAFRLAGGIILFNVAVQMLHVRMARMTTSPEEEAEAAEKEDVAIVPLAIPMLSGPGAITTVMVLSGEYTALAPKILLALAILLVSLSTYLILSRSALLGRVLRRSGVNILTRIMGLILAVVAVEIVSKGLKGMFPHLFS